ncbi:MAG TPA: AAA family ATPase, partial [Candidatus Methylacidiphilales bacterium]|nr:AAA family ATPase [Candidatus Methylacidiphilales bacterium]
MNQPPPRTPPPPPQPTPPPPSGLAAALDENLSVLAKQDPAALLESLPARVKAIKQALEPVVVGQHDTIDAILYALLCRGHCLLVGVPGLGKTLLVNALGRVLGLPFSRIQFTPDLMPSDITGTEILEEDLTTGHRKFVFVPGPVFTNILLADEINRTPPKTQAALLEAMQEKVVTIAGKRYKLQEPFIVLATQNPIEQEGTYPLPEAQLDRFLFELPLTYPTLEEELKIVSQHQFSPTDQLPDVLTRTEILACRDAVAQVPAAPNVIDYAVRLVRASRPEEKSAPDYVRRWLKWGASPRASQNLILAGKARAACLGRFNVACEDVAALAPL